MVLEPHLNILNARPREKEGDGLQQMENVQRFPQLAIVGLTNIAVLRNGVTQTYKRMNYSQYRLKLRFIELATRFNGLIFSPDPTKGVEGPLEVPRRIP